MSDRSKTRLYYAACVCLLIVAAALRFYDLPGRSLGYDEAIAANNARGSLGDVLDNTRSNNSSPILYPLVLYAVQKVESSRTSVRIVPAIASVLTVAALLLLLPRVGVSRWAAFVAALLSVLSLSAIEHARDSREYSIDAFVAVLMIAGLLAYLRGKHKGGIYVLFCISLFVAPLVQYGLVLMVIAIFGTIGVMEVKTYRGRRAGLRDGLRFPAGWIWRRLAYLVWPVACFATGSVISYVATLRRHLEIGNFTGPNPFEVYEFGYYQGERGDIPAMIRFVLSQTEEVLRYHMTTEFIIILGLVGFGVFLIIPFRKNILDVIATLFVHSFRMNILDAIAILFVLSLVIAACASLVQVYLYLEQIELVLLYHMILVLPYHMISVLPYHMMMEILIILGLVGFGIFLIISFGKNRLDMIAILFVLSIVIAACASVVQVYLYAGSRHSMYLAPIIFLAFGHALYSIVVDASSLTRRRWTVHVGMALVVGIIAFSGTAAIRDSNLYRNDTDVDVVLMTLEQRTRDGDVVYVSGLILPNVEFYHRVRSDDYCYGEWGDDALEVCARRLFLERPRAERMWLLVGHGKGREIVDVFSVGRNDIELVKDHGRHLLYVWSDPFREEYAAMISSYQYAVNVEPGVRSVFDVHMKERTLIYIKEPCVLDEVAAPFFLHVTPANVEDLSEERKEYEFDDLDFAFSSFGIVDEGRCIAVRDLPEYDIESISTGQFGEDGEIWWGGFGEEYDALKLAYQYAANVEPGARSVFDVHMKERTLIYIKEPCVRGDVAAPFFLHVTPANVDDLPEERREYGFDNFDFAFSSFGIVGEGRCVAVRDLPEYDIESISTGQFGEDGRIWSGGFSLGESDAMLSAYQYAVDSAPAAQSVFDIYVGEGRLIYVKEPCVVGDVAAPFFLHVTPTNVEDLPEERREYGFDNFDFAFSSFGIVDRGRCIAVRDLPEYDIESILTGQFAEDAEIWSGGFSLGESDALLSAYQYAVGSAPAAQSVFDVYVREGRLIYVKEPCVVGDVAARFFLHVTPADVEDLPEERKEYGFDNLDFEFSWFGVVAEGRCIAARDIPEYDIESILTGQFVDDVEIWRSEFSFDE